MASIRQIQNRVKLFSDFQKVINIKKTIVMKEIMEWRRRIRNADFRKKLFHNNLIDIENKYKLLDASYFDLDSNKVPIDRNLYFILPNPPSDRIGAYSNRVLIEFIKKNHSAQDMYVLIGDQLEKLFIANNLKIVKVMRNIDINDHDIYNRISFQVFRGHSDLLFKSAKFIFLSTIEQRVVEDTLFPISPSKHEFTKDETNQFTEDMKLIAQTDITKASFYKNVERVTENVLNQVVNMQVYSAVINYRLAMAMRELQTLDEKEKNIVEEIEKAKIRMQHLRKDNITNELLTNLVAFKANHNKPDRLTVEDYVIRRKKREEE